jgi:hypothetical protein
MQGAWPGPGAQGDHDGEKCAPVEAAVPPAIYLAIAVEGQFLTPMLLGRRLELNPFANFLAIAFFTWLWGPLPSSSPCRF